MEKRENYDEFIENARFIINGKSAKNIYHKFILSEHKAFKNRESSKINRRYKPRNQQGDQQEAEKVLAPYQA